MEGLRHWRSMAIRSPRSMWGSARYSSTASGKPSGRSSKPRMLQALGSPGVNKLVDEPNLPCDTQKQRSTWGRCQSTDGLLLRCFGFIHCRGPRESRSDRHEGTEEFEMIRLRPATKILSVLRDDGWSRRKMPTHTSTQEPGATSSNSSLPPCSGRCSRLDFSGPGSRPSFRS